MKHPLFYFTVRVYDRTEKKSTFDSRHSLIFQSTPILNLFRKMFTPSYFLSIRVTIVQQFLT